MPIYEFECDDCMNSFETLVLAGHGADAACPLCQGVKLSRKFSIFASGRGNGDSNSTSAPSMQSGGCLWRWMWLPLEIADLGYWKRMRLISALSEFQGGPLH